MEFRIGKIHQRRLALDIGNHVLFLSDEELMGLRNFLRACHKGKLEELLQQRTGASYDADSSDCQSEHDLAYLEKVGWT